jgi:hypothetical protein
MAARELREKRQTGRGQERNPLKTHASDLLPSTRSHLLQFYYLTIVYQNLNPSMD